MSGNLEKGTWFVWLLVYILPMCHTALTLQIPPVLKGKSERNLETEENDAKNRMKVLAPIYNIKNL